MYSQPQLPPTRALILTVLLLGTVKQEGKMIEIHAEVSGIVSNANGNCIAGVCTSLKLAESAMLYYNGRLNNSVRLKFD